MRIATWNVEWFNALFDADDRLIEDATPSGRRDVTCADQAKGIATVLRVLDADAVMLQEAPDTSRGRVTTRALENFATHFGLRTSRAVTGFLSESQQEIALIHDPEVLTAIHDPQGMATGKRGASDAPRFDGVFRVDMDGDGQDELVRFSKPPLELMIETATGRYLRMIGVHVKSKAPHGARNPGDARRLAQANRRKQFAQCLWLRQRIDIHLAAGDPLIVLGDFNDGPGIDDAPESMLPSAVATVLGRDRAFHDRLHDRHATLALLGPGTAVPTSARFLMDEDGRYFSALLDYIMISGDLLDCRPRWRIWHPFDEPACYRDPTLRDALLAASDHFPVTLDLAL
jgi:exonuclease III